MAPAIKMVEAIAISETIEPIEASAPGAESDRYSEIAALAYELWMLRGCPIGSPEEDWFRAEQQIKDRRTNVVKTTSDA